VDTVLFLRLLIRHRRLLAIIAVVAVLVGSLTVMRPGIPPQSRQYDVGVASARVLIDTPNSQVVDLGQKEDVNAGVLPARAVLLANLLTTSPLRDEIAHRSRVSAKRLYATNDVASAPGTTTPAPTDGSAPPDGPNAWALKADTDLSLPLITVHAQAPTPADAARLADSAVAVLRDHVASVSAQESVPAARQLVVKVLGGAQAGTETHGPSRLIGIALALFVFLLGCAGVMLLSTLASQWYAAQADEDLAEEMTWDDFELGEEPAPEPADPEFDEPPPRAADPDLV
jgi:hypothetical protein